MSIQPVVLITGASGGIGAATARDFARKGYALVLTGREEKALKELGASFQKDQVPHSIVPGSLEDPVFPEKLIAETEKCWGRIDVLVNNAAWRTRETLRTISLETWDKTIRVCLTAPAFLTRAAAALMERNRHGGSIINISSIQSFFAGGISPAYTACKAGLESLTYEAAVLYGPSGIRVNVILPGAVDTAMSKDIQSTSKEDCTDVFTAAMLDHTPLGRLASPEEIASAIVWLASDEASFITGSSLVVDGGFTHNFNAYSLKKLQLPKEF
jgi:NAD(P)-dependent dehydrogenase (short-subunit alcohol dehydrogenase family)